jgi:hypothetical protein
MSDLLTKMIYDPTSPSGLRWRLNFEYPRANGKPVGYLDRSTGYWVYSSKVNLYCHRIIWEIFNGPIPEDMMIDHKDGNKANNNIGNLRLVTYSQNNINKKKYCAQKYKGVYLNKKGFMSRICVNGKDVYLGTYPTQEEAHEAYKAAAIKYHGEFARFE